MIILYYHFIPLFISFGSLFSYTYISSLALPSQRRQRKSTAVNSIHPRLFRQFESPALLVCFVLPCSTPYVVLQHSLLNYTIVFFLNTLSLSGISSKIVLLASFPRSPSKPTFLPGSSPRTSLPPRLYAPICPFPSPSLHPLSLTLSSSSPSLQLLMLLVVGVVQTMTSHDAPPTSISLARYSIPTLPDIPSDFPSDILFGISHASPSPLL